MNILSKLFVNGVTYKNTPMRNVLLFCITLFAFTACEEVDKLTQFEIEYNESVTIPASSIINTPFNIATPDVESDSEQNFQINNTNKDLIEEIYLKELDLTITAPAGEDFSFLEEVTIYINADGLPEQEIASKKPVPSTTGMTLVLDVTQADLQSYIKKDEFSLRLSTIMDETIASDHTIKIHSVFFIDAKVLGL